MGEMGGWGWNEPEGVQIILERMSDEVCALIDQSEDPLSHLCGDGGRNDAHERS